MLSKFQSLIPIETIESPLPALPKHQVGLALQIFPSISIVLLAAPYCL